MIPLLQFLLEYRLPIVVIVSSVACVIVLARGIATAEDGEITSDDLLRKS